MNLDTFYDLFKTTARTIELGYIARTPVLEVEGVLVYDVLCLDPPHFCYESQFVISTTISNVGAPYFYDWLTVGGTIGLGQDSSLPYGSSIWHNSTLN